MSNDIKNFLFSWCGRNKLALPSYAISASREMRANGTINNQPSMFEAELQIAGIDFVAKGQAKAKKLAQTEAAREMCKYLLKIGRIPRSVIKSVPNAQDLLEDPREKQAAAESTVKSQNPVEKAKSDYKNWKKAETVVGNEVISEVQDAEESEGQRGRKRGLSPEIEPRGKGKEQEVMFFGHKKQKFDLSACSFNSSTDSLKIPSTSAAVKEEIPKTPELINLEETLNKIDKFRETTEFSSAPLGGWIPMKPEAAPQQKKGTWEPLKKRETTEPYDKSGKGDKSEKRGLFAPLEYKNVPVGGQCSGEGGGKEKPSSSGQAKRSGFLAALELKNDVPVGEKVGGDDDIEIINVKKRKRVTDDDEVVVIEEGGQDNKEPEIQEIEADGTPVRPPARDKGKDPRQATRDFITHLTSTHAGNLKKLNTQVMQHYDSNAQDQDTFNWKMEVRSRLQAILQREFAECFLFAVGSTVNLLGSYNSDMDLCFVVPDPYAGTDTTRNYAMEVLRFARQVLWRARVARKVDLIPAKVPILKLELTPPYEELEVDINCNNVAGIRNSHLLHYYARVDERFPAISLMVKHWAINCGINDASDWILEQLLADSVGPPLSSVRVQPPGVAQPSARFPPAVRRAKRRDQFASFRRSRSDSGPKFQ